MMRGVGLFIVLAWALPALGEPSEPGSTQAAHQPSKKQEWLAQKAAAPRQRKSSPPRMAQHPVTLFHLWTHEILPVLPDELPSREEVNRFLRCHFTDQTIEMDRHLLQIVLQAARRFRAHRVEVVSAFRSPKYNLLLRKKGHEVARDSEHPKGHAIDFRLIEVPLRALVRFVRSLRLGGVGYYPSSQFVHVDVRGPALTGRKRWPFWRGS